MARIADRKVLVWLYMMRVSSKMEKLSAEHLQSFGLTDAQFDVLAHLVAEEGISQQALSEKLFVTKGNVCGLIDRLEQRGWVERRCDPQDRRANLLFLTEEGKKLAQRVVPEHERFVAEQVSLLSQEEQESLRAILRKLAASMPG